MILYEGIGALINFMKKRTLVRECVFLVNINGVPGRGLPAFCHQ